jgi:uncharacterized protein DUF2628
MPTFTIHQPPLKDGATVSPARFVFVRDGFYFWAFVLAPLWLLMHRLWLAFFGYVVVTIGVAVALILLGAPGPVRATVAFLIALLVGLEAATLWRWTLARRKWKTLGFVVGDDAETAERRFYAEWSKQHGAHSEMPAVAVTTATPSYSAPQFRGPPSSSDVIGLFPEPGGHR